MFCKYCGAKLHENGKFCSVCGKAVVLPDSAPKDENPVSLEKEPVPDEIPESTVPESATSEPELSPVSLEKEPMPEEIPESTVPESVTTEPELSSVSLEKEPVPEETAEFTEYTAPAPKKHTLLKKNLKAIAVYIVSAAVTAALGAFVIPKAVFPKLAEKAADSMYANGKYDNAELLYKINGSKDAVSDVKFANAEALLEAEDYVRAAALYSELENAEYDGADLTGKLDEALGGRCRTLINQGKYTVAAAVSTQISESFLAAGIINDALVSQAKIKSAEGLNLEAYELVRNVNTQAAYDSDAYDAIVYNYGAELYNSKNFADALTVLQDAKSDAAKELFSASAYYLANEYAEDKNYSEAAAYYEKAGDFLSAAEKAKECYYQLGVSEYSAENYQQALEYFEKIGDYKDSKEYCEKIADENSNSSVIVSKDGWYLDAFVCGYVDPYTYEAGPETDRISKYGEFDLVYTLKSVKNTPEYITLEVTIVSPAGTTLTDTAYYMYADDWYYSSFSFEEPETATVGTAYFTVKILETDEIIGTYYFEIY